MQQPTSAHLPVLTPLEHIGLAEYPGLSALAYTPPTQPSLRATLALRAQRSLLLRLLARRPWRARELCQLRLGDTRQSAASAWPLNMPLADDAGHQHIGLPVTDRPMFPGDLVRPLNEYVDLWRSMLAEPDQAALLITRRGEPYTPAALNDEVARVIWRYARWSISLPQIRQWWTAEFSARSEPAQPAHLARRHR